MSGSNAPGMEFLSMAHSRASTQHLCPKVGDTLVTNLRAPLLTVVEDTSPGAHDTLMAACDPLRYKELGVEKWAEHGSCAENLVLALQELNKQIGLKGRKAIGSDVTVNSVPAPLNLFMNIPWTENGELSFDPPKGKRGEYVKLRAERDVILVMSACPQDILEINGKKPMVAHFVVESPTEEDKKKANEQEKKAQQIIEKARRRTESEKEEPPKSQIAAAKAQPPKAKLQQSAAGPSQTLGRGPSQTPSRTPSQATSQGQQQSKPTPKRQTSTSSGQRAPPRKLSTATPAPTRKPTQASPPLKETQRIESPPPKRQPIAKSGKKAPKKLERRGGSSASVPRA
jgi:uncharacterized protein YcgI (DUF1989 family)